MEASMGLTIEAEGTIADLGPETGGQADATVSSAVGRRRRKGRWLVRVAFAWLACIVLLAIFAPLLGVGSYSSIGEAPLEGPSWSNGIDGLLGTDHLGRGVLARLLYGARASIVVGLGAVLVGIVVGTALGVAAGYRRGWLDRVILVAVDAQLAFPTLVLLLALVAVLQPSLRALVLVLGLSSVPSFARIARATTLTIKTRDYVLAARATGASGLRVVVREVLPSVIRPVLAYSVVVVASLIIAEGSLSFLGLGVPPPQPSWGGMIADGKAYLRRDPHVVMAPATALFLTILSLNIIGDARLNRRDRRAGALER